MSNQLADIATYQTIRDADNAQNVFKIVVESCLRKLDFPDPTFGHGFVIEEYRLLTMTLIASHVYAATCDARIKVVGAPRDFVVPLVAERPQVGPDRAWSIRVFGQAAVRISDAASLEALSNAFSNFLKNPTNPAQT